MRCKTSFFAGMVAQLHECTKCKRVAIISDYPETLDVRLIRLKMGYSQHFEGERKI